MIAQMEESLRVLSGIAQRTRAKKLLISGAAVTGAALVAKRLASRSHGLDFGRLFDRMPENTPPKLMFRNQRDPGEHGAHPATARKRTHDRRASAEARPRSLSAPAQAPDAQSAFI